MLLLATPRILLLVFILAASTGEELQNTVSLSKSFEDVPLNTENTPDEALSRQKRQINQLIDPVTGHITTPTFDPVTGELIDPNTGIPIRPIVNPATGKLIDANSGNLLNQNAGGISRTNFPSVSHTAIGPSGTPVGPPVISSVGFGSVGDFFSGLAPRLPNFALASALGVGSILTLLAATGAAVGFNNFGEALAARNAELVAANAAQDAVIDGIIEEANRQGIDLTNARNLIGANGRTLALLEDNLEEAENNLAGLSEQFASLMSNFTNSFADLEALRALVEQNQMNITLNEEQIDMNMESISVLARNLMKVQGKQKRLMKRLFLIAMILKMIAPEDKREFLNSVFPNQKPMHYPHKPMEPLYPWLPSEKPHDDSDHPGYPTEHPWLPTEKPEHPWYPTEVPDHPWYHTEKPVHPWYPSEEPEHPGYPTEEPEHPWYPTEEPPYHVYPTYPPYPTQKPTKKTTRKPPTKPTKKPTKKPHVPQYPYIPHYESVEDHDIPLFPKLPEHPPPKRPLEVGDKYDEHVPPVPDNSYPAYQSERMASQELLEFMENWNVNDKDSLYALHQEQS